MMYHNMKNFLNKLLLVVSQMKATRNTTSDYDDAVEVAINTLERWVDKLTMTKSYKEYTETIASGNEYKRNAADDDEFKYKESQTFWRVISILWLVFGKGYEVWVSNLTPQTVGYIRCNKKKMSRKNVRQKKN